MLLSSKVLSEKGEKLEKVHGKILENQPIDFYKGGAFIYNI